MPVKIRLTRMGKKKQPSYRVVVVDSRKPRDGAYIEQIGRYDPRQEPSLVEIDNERALDWLQKGAQPTERTKKLLEISGAWTRFAIDRGEIHTVGDSKPEPAPEPEPVAVVVEEEPEVAEAAEEEADDASKADQ
jgi:small subunit ribosomal protein S16